MRRAWAAGDELRLQLNVAPRRVWADPRVASAVGKVALQQGPIVYCLEGVDHDVPVAALALPRQAALAEEPELVSGLVALTAQGSAAAEPVQAEPRTTEEGSSLYRDRPVPQVPRRLRAVPYFAWANRGQADMTVWVHER